MAQLESMVARHHEAHRRAMLAAGTVAAAIYNANPFRDKDAKLLSPLDFVPESWASQLRGAEVSQLAQQSLDDQVALLTKFFGPPRFPN